MREAVASPERYWRELFVSASIDGVTLEGFIDLLYETPQGLVIVDYKTDFILSTQDVEAKLEGCRGHERTELARPQTVFRIQPFALCEGTVMGGDRVLAKTVAQPRREPLRHSSCVHEHECRLVFVDELFEAVVDFLPHLVRHDRFERRARYLERDVEFAAVAVVHDKRNDGMTE